MALCAALLIPLCFLAAPPARAADIAVDLELVLAVDTSFSIDQGEQRMQLDGYVHAFRHPEVLAAIRSGPHRRIAVAFVEWGGAGFQRLKVGWTLIADAASADAFADRLDAYHLTSLPRTSIADAIRYAAGLFDGNGYQGIRRVIDISGDGPNNQGMAVTEARDIAVSQGITINGLPILLRPGEPAGYFDLENLDVYYQDCVIGGAGSFTVPVYDKNNFAEAIRRKLILEIAGAVPRAVSVRHLPAPAPRIDCLIGERLWQLWLNHNLEE